VLKSNVAYEEIAPSGQTETGPKMLRTTYGCQERKYHQRSGTREKGQNGSGQFGALGVGKLKGRGYFTGELRR